MMLVDVRSSAMTTSGRVAFALHRLPSDLIEDVPCLRSWLVTSMNRDLDDGGSIIEETLTATAFPAVPIDLSVKP